MLKTQVNKHMYKEFSYLYSNACFYFYVICSEISGHMQPQIKTAKLPVLRDICNSSLCYQIERNFEKKLSNSNFQSKTRFNCFKLKFLNGTAKFFRQTQTILNRNHFSYNCRKRRLNLLLVIRFSHIWVEKSLKNSTFHTELQISINCNKIFFEICGK